MKILFITYELPPIGGGGGRAAWQIARRMVRRRHEVCLLTSLFRGLKDEETDEGVRIRRIPVHRTEPDACPPRELFSFMHHSVPAALKMADEFDPDVACAFFAVPGGPAAWWMKRRKGIPYVLCLRGSDVPRRELSRHQPLHMVTRPFIRRFCRGADGITAVSEALRLSALKLDPKLDIRVVPNGVDTDFFEPAGADPLGRDIVNIVFVGRLQEFKRVQDAILALPAIEKALGRPVRFTIVGDGPQMEPLRKLWTGLKPACPRTEVRFTGWLNPDSVRVVYAEAALTVLPSLVEGHPNVLLEAMAMGLPCVVSDAPGLREMVENEKQGLLVPPKDPAAIAAAIAAILSDPERHAKMRTAARRRAEELSWDHAAREYEDILDEAARRAAERP